MTPTTPVSDVGIVGLGAVGTSIGLALRAAGEGTVGFDTSLQHLQEAVDLGAITTASPDFNGFFGCQVVFVAVPPGEVVSVARSVLERTHATVIDVASVKGEIARAINDPRFVPSHPLRGTHVSGPQGAAKDLFVGGVWVVCPTASTSPYRLWMAEGLIRRMGAEPVRLGAAEHDSVTARTSHLPHVAASSLVHVVGTRDRAFARRLIGGGFLDSTRIARANPDLWTDIALHNRAEVSDSISEMMSRLSAVKKAIDEADREAVLAFFAEACRLIEESVPLRTPRNIRRVPGATSAWNRRRGSFVSELGGAH